MSNVGAYWIVGFQWIGVAWWSPKVGKSEQRNIKIASSMGTK